jgi:hypothetical protein
VLDDVVRIHPGTKALQVEKNVRRPSRILVSWGDRSVESKRF